MNCNETRKWMSPYLDSELDPTKTFEVSQHLESCDTCRVRFEKESRADDIIAKRLRRCEPFVNWQAVERRILSAPQKVMRLRPRWWLAAAACIAAIIIVWPEQSIADPAAQWAVDELHKLSPECEPFSGEECSTAEIEARAREVLSRKIDLGLQDGRIAKHPIKLVDARERKCPAGNSRLEIRLNCCGKPVLLIIGRCEKLGELSSFNKVLEKDGSSWEQQRSAHNFKYRISARRTGDCVIVAVAPHQVVQLVSNISLGSN